ncbi:MAG: caspase family protein [Deltaproteobacteria bacterium]|nr:caspase family protein [Deltaproteobacteria bacterium]
MLRAPTMPTPAPLLLLAALAAQPTWPSLSGDLPRAGGGEHDVAVVVGASSYVFLPPIAGAADNADDWAQWLGRVRGVPPERLTILRERDATKEKIERALASAAGAARADGVLWFVFIGHGAPAPGGDDGTLLGIDTQAELESLGARGVRQQRVLELVRGGKQKDSVLVYDACFSGRAPDGGAPLVPGMQATVPVRKSAPARVTLLSASDSFAGPLPGTTRPAFSYTLLGALRGWGDGNGDGRVSVGEAFSFTRATLQAALKSDGRLPKQSGPAELVVATNAKERAPDVNALVLGRCPSGTSWDGRGCGAALASAPTISGALAALREGVRDGRAQLEAATTMEAKHAAAATLERALGLYPLTKEQAGAAALAAEAEFFIAAVEAERLEAWAIRSDDLETQQAELRRLDEEVRPVLRRFMRAASEYGDHAFLVPALVAGGHLCDAIRQLYVSAPCPKQIDQRRCAEYHASMAKVTGAHLDQMALTTYGAALTEAKRLGVTGELVERARKRVKEISVSGK